jgi:hypothetical protein
MDKNLKDILIRISDYMMEFELKHFEECNEEEKNNHIYNDVIKLNKYIKE